MHEKIDINNLIWKSDYNIGDLRTDSEHMNLFNIAKKAFLIQANVTTEEQAKELKKIIQSLFEYTATHFKNEERYMYMINYPDLQRHKDIHKHMLSKLNDFVQEINTLSIDMIKAKLCAFIESYFITHIIEEDKRIEYWTKSLSKIRKHTEWKKQFTVGDERLDKEHQELFDIVNEAYTEVKDNQRTKKIKSVLSHLYKYMKEHFKHEEEYMKEISYPYFKEHKELHGEIIKDVNEFVYEINSIETSLFEKELARIIDNHVIEHILVEDKKFFHWKQNHKTN